MKALSLFSGCGGLDIGVEAAGFENVANIECDKNAVQTLKQWREVNHKNNEIFADDIRNIDPSIFKAHKIDLLHGGPPCQAFSLIGKRDSLDDPRGQLLFEVIRFAAGLLPKAIMIENVKGLLSAPDEKGQVGGAFELFIKELAKLNYVPKWAVINAADYGIPQKRERVFIVATYGHNGFEFPAPTHSETQNNSLFPLKPHESAWKRIANLPNPTHKGETETFPNHIDVTPDRDAERISYVSEGGYLVGEKNVPPSILMNLTKKDTTKYRRLSKNEPSLTLRGGEIFYHPTENRYLTPREYMRIHTFPDSLVLQGPIRRRSGNVKDLDQHRLVANAVPPKIAEIVAKEIIKAI
ncbi:MAG: DNA cytosine methyltransferase [Prevotellaceae bacterium]|jgi:DNA (cytosine-5)-methyltransferase 1|nr:DNA cytosine methyltransferase [Prevotellaceae bacterium]